MVALLQAMLLVLVCVIIPINMGVVMYCLATHQSYRSVVVRIGTYIEGRWL